MSNQLSGIVDPSHDEVDLDFELPFRQFPDNDFGENEMLYILEMLLANNDDQKCLELFWKTARARVSRFENAVLLADNGHCTVGNSIVQKLKIILLKIATLDDVLNELLTYCETLLHHEFGAKYANCIDDEIKVLIDKHAKLMEQYENFQEEKGRLFEIRHICDVLNARLFELYESVKEARREKFHAGVRTPVNKEPRVLQSCNVLQMSPMEKVQAYFNQSKNELTETLERRQRYYHHNGNNVRYYLTSRRNMTNSNSNMQDRREMGEFSSAVGTSSAGQSDESTTCSCGRSECNVCNPPAENAHNFPYNTSTIS
ncbi:Trigger factor [Trichinella spiralis]|uniref:Trigger factor n=1 Tax=Trichinella spiralis TaxID=6334 RepID=A0ABR3L1S2_TRISP